MKAKKNKQPPKKSTAMRIFILVLAGLLLLSFVIFPVMNMF
ncbi:hypothetical protein [Ruminococcus sp.]|nr:hypothetical protein [Ruminococcus sp.]MDD7555760.1 hypothetical protein [Ruminococcus sp.]MDY4963637.1 hypothetical protein [Ruminococcus callidus]